MPDAEVEIQIENVAFHFWIEYDRGTEYSKDVAVKYMKYFEYFDQIKQKNIMTYPNILFITESTKERLKNLVVFEPEYTGKWSWSHASKSFKNVVLKGVTMADDIRSMSYVVDEFLQKDRFLFIDYATFEQNGFETEFLNMNAESFNLLNFIKKEGEKLTEKQNNDKI